MEIRPAGRGDLASGLAVIRAAFGIPAARLGAQRWAHGVSEGQRFLASVDGDAVGAAAEIAFGASAGSGVSRRSRTRRAGAWRPP